MEAAALKAERGHDRDMAHAWHTAIFALNGYAGKLKGKSLSDYLISRDRPKRSNAAKAVAFFHNLKARGFPVEITRIAHNSDELPPLPQSQQQG